MTVLISFLVLLAAIVGIGLGFRYYLHESARRRIAIYITNTGTFFDRLSLFEYYVILRYPLAPIAVIFFSTPDKLSLTKFKWLMTRDVGLDGDSGWKNEHWAGQDTLNTWIRIQWLWRNGASTLAYEQFGYNITKDGELKEVATHNNLLKVFKSADGQFFLYREFVPTKDGKYIEYFYGWAIQGPQLMGEDRVAKLVFTVRKRTNTN